MLNYANLNDVEFEALCCDIMERKLGVPLRRFGPGRDGGVDLTDDVNGKNIIVQVKHYQMSTNDALIRSLKNELTKVERLQPEKYYICCSRALSVENINALYQHFQEYMDSDRQIITIIEIDNFLKEPENRDILKKHFKLWLDDTGILQDLGNDELFVDCEAFMDDAEEIHKLFVRTSAFDRALKVLENDHTLCILGDPGVGKSITSKMLVLHYASQGYRVRYTSNVSDLATLKTSLRNDPDAKEVILLDDCFGQAYFEMKSTQSTELISLIKYVKRRANKVLILNSRVTIFQEARCRQRDLLHCIEREDFKVQILNINEISDEEKAKILYNHLFFSDIPYEYFEEIKKERRYWQILKHRNFNPRIIEFVCNPKRYEMILPNEFFPFIMKHLENPSEMWKDEYEDRLQPVDRILLQTIYSLTTTTVDEEIVRRCFERRITDIPTIDKTVEQFNRSLERLNKSFIRIIDNKGIKNLSMKNPSINDFMDGRLLHNISERTELISSICTVKQLRLLPKIERIPYVVDLLKTGKIDQFIVSDSYDQTSIIGQCILVTGLCIDRYRQSFYDYILQRGSGHNNSLLPGEVDVRKQVVDEILWDFYDLTSFFEQSDHLYHFVSKYDLDDGVEFISSIDGYFKGNDRGRYVLQVEKYLREAIDEFCYVDAADYESCYDVEDAIKSATCRYPDGDEVDEDDAAATLDECIQQKAYAELESLISKLPEQFRYLADHLQEDDIDVDGSDYIIQDYMSGNPGHYEYDDDYEPIEQRYSEVDAIFQR